jgi:hydrolase, P-loop family
MQKFANEQQMIDFGKALAKTVKIPAVIELVGDVGTGKTTITKGLAQGLGIDEEITSPTFTLSKRYAFHHAGKDCFLVHYDFYRLNDPGIMSEDLLENIHDPNTLTVIEWGDSVSDLLPEDHLRFYINLNEDGSRSINS